MPPAPSRRCSLNEPTTRGSSRRSRIIAMSTPLTVVLLTWHSLRTIRHERSEAAPSRGNSIVSAGQAT
ncbi:predicted protein [Streptomyces sp. C]|nr:predicted protein [Streptomyces sp. C]